MQKVNVATVLVAVLALGRGLRSCEENKVIYETSGEKFASAKPQNYSSTHTNSLRPGTRIVGGSTTTVQAHPWIVSLQIDGAHTCAGTIVSQNTILTTAYCVDNQVAASYKIVTGTTRWAQGGNKYNVASITMSPSFDGLDNDIAILKTAIPITFNDRVQAVPVTDVVPTDTTPVTVTGWGTLEDSDTAPLSDVLREVTVPVVSLRQCQIYYTAIRGATVTENMLCAGEETGGKDACGGDVGGPLTQNGVLVGIVSWGAGCAQPKLPGVYTNLSAHTVRDWLRGQGVVHN